MQIDYKNKNIKNVCTNASKAKKLYGEEMAAKIQQRIDEIRAAASVKEMMQYKIGRCHKLTNNRKGQYAVDLVHPRRLVFEEKKVDGDTVIIIEIVDYH